MAILEPFKLPSFSHNHDATTDALLELARRTLSVFPNPDDRVTLVGFFSGTFWRFDLDRDREQVLHSQWSICSGGQIEHRLSRELMGIPVNSRAAFCRALDFVQREMLAHYASSNAEAPGEDSSLSDAAGSGSVRVQGTPFGQHSGHHDGEVGTADAEAVPRTRQPGGVAPGNAQDAGNATLVRNQGRADLGSALQSHHPGPSVQPPTGSAIQPASVPLVQPPTGLAVPATNNSDQQCPGCWAPSWLTGLLQYFGAQPLLNDVAAASTGDNNGLSE